MISKVGAKGQVVIPKAMLDRLGISPGDEVDFSRDDGAVRVEPVQDLVSLRRTLAGANLRAELEAERRAERDR